MVVQGLLIENPQQEVNDKRKPIGNGYSIECVTEKIIIVYRYGIIAKKVEVEAGIDKRRLVPCPESSATLFGNLK